MKFEELKKELMKKKLCNHCFGRQFKQLFPHNKEEEIAIAVKQNNTIEEAKKFLEDKKQIETKQDFNECELCNGLFGKTEEFKKKLIEKSKEVEFSNFLIGNVLPDEVLENQDKLWAEVGCEYCEPIKREINRLFGEFFAKQTGKKTEFKNPEVVFIINYKKGEVETQINDLYIYGRYNKLKRGLPQTKWPCRLCKGTGIYKGETCPNCGGTGKQFQETVEELIAPKAVEATKASGESFHGSGREDRDALMLGNGRPFVLELKEPKIRTIDYKKLEQEINDYCQGKVKVNSLRKSSKEELIELKKALHDKLYEAIVKTEEGYEKLKRLDEFFVNKELKQRTPTRVAHRRKDKIRKRRVYYVKTEPIDKTHFKAVIKAESGTYIKELISGDYSRTKPSFSEILWVPCVCEQLNVLEVIDKPKQEEKK